MKVKAIGYAETPYQKLEDMPRPKKEDLEKGKIRKEIGNVILYKEYKDGLLGLKEGDYAVILSYFHESKKVPEERSLTFLHPLLEKEMGVFATRTPNRPNPIAMTIIKILKINENILEVQGVDMLNNTPILDIKPYTNLNES